MKIKAMLCVFCGSCRIRLVCGSDDRGAYVTVQCDKCEATGPGMRNAIADENTVTATMKEEAIDAWNQVSIHIVGPRFVAIEISPPRRRKAIRLTPKANGHVRQPPASEAPASAETAIATVLNKPAPNGHNGHHAL